MPVSQLFGASIVDKTSCRLLNREIEPATWVDLNNVGGFRDAPVPLTKMEDEAMMASMGLESSRDVFVRHTSREGPERLASASGLRATTLIGRLR